MNDKHTPTPGPWKVDKRAGDEWWFGGRDGAEIAIETAEGATIAVLGGSLSREGRADADARLLAAAPDLLEALEAIVKQRALLKQRIGTDLDIAINRARAAISRATSGEQT